MSHGLSAPVTLFPAGRCPKADGQSVIGLEAVSETVAADSPGRVIARGGSQPNSFVMAVVVLPGSITGDR
jgi:hypothetical protein